MVVPARTVQEAQAVAAGDLPPLDVDASNVFTQSERILQEHLDVVQRSGPPPDGFYRRGGEDQEQASQGEQVEGGRDEEASLPPDGFYR